MHNNKLNSSTHGQRLQNETNNFIIFELIVFQSIFMLNDWCRLW